MNIQHPLASYQQASTLLRHSSVQGRDSSQEQISTPQVRPYNIYCKSRLGP
jgi:hypothetical protein